MAASEATESQLKMQRTEAEATATAEAATSPRRARAASADRRGASRGSGRRRTSSVARAVPRPGGGGLGILMLSPDAVGAREEQIRDGRDGQTRAATTTVTSMTWPVVEATAAADARKGGRESGRSVGDSTIAYRDSDGPVICPQDIDTVSQITSILAGNTYATTRSSCYFGTGGGEGKGEGGAEAWRRKGAAAT